MTGKSRSRHREAEREREGGRERERERESQAGEWVRSEGGASQSAYRGLLEKEANHIYDYIYDHRKMIRRKRVAATSFLFFTRKRTAFARTLAMN